MAEQISTGDVQSVETPNQIGGDETTRTGANIVTPDQIEGESTDAPNPVQPTNPVGELALQESSPPSVDTGDGAIMLPLAVINRDDEYIVRENLNPQGVQDYTELFTDYKEAVARNEKPKYPFPPIVVWLINGLYILLCGQHRFEAALKAGLTEILVQVFVGSPEEAFMIAFKDNAKHGVRMDDNDKRVAIIKALKRFPDKSLGFFHKELGCSKSTLSVLRNELYSMWAFLYSRFSFMVSKAWL